MKRSTYTVFLQRVILLLFLSLLVSCGGGGSSNPVIPDYGSVSPTLNVSSTQPDVGTTFTVTVTIPSITDLYQADLELSYDHSLIEIVGATDGSVIVGDTLDSLVAHAFDDWNGNLLYSFSNADNSSYTGTNGTLCTITFIALSPGITMLDFTGSIYWIGKSGSIDDPGIPAVMITIP